MADEKKKSTFWSEFKTFIARGNVMDMAVGVVVGSAFTAIVNSLVQGIINPLIGKLMGGLDLSEYRSPRTNTDTAKVFTDIIIGLLSRRCWSCKKANTTR